MTASPTVAGDRGSPRPVGVVVVDDQAVFRQAARDVIAATAGFRALGEAACGEDALRLADELEPDLVLVDLRMPGVDGLETARRLLAAHPGAVVVLVSTEDANSVPQDAESCGAAAFVEKAAFGPAVLRSLWRAHGRGR